MDTHGNLRLSLSRLETSIHEPLGLLHALLNYLI